MLSRCRPFLFPGYFFSHSLSCHEESTGNVAAVVRVECAAADYCLSAVLRISADRDASVAADWRRGVLDRHGIARIVACQADDREVAGCQQTMSRQSVREL